MTDPKPDADNVVELGVPVGDVWAAITTPEGLRSFLADQVEVRPGVGGSIRLGWEGQLMAPGTIEVWEPGRRLLVRGNGICEEWLLESRGGRTVVRLVFSGYGDTDWDETYDALDDTGALILEMLATWLEEHRGAPPTQVRAVAHLPVSRSAGWAAALGPAGLSVADDPDRIDVGLDTRLALRGGDPVAAQVRMYGVRNEALFGIPEWNGARLLLMVRAPDAESCTVTLGLTTYGLGPEAVEAARDRLEQTTQEWERRIISE